MEFNKERLHMSRFIGNALQTITIDDDFIVPDSKPDIAAKIKDDGFVVINREKALQEKALVGGSLCFKLLYSTGEGCASMEGSIPFEENVAIQKLSEQDIVKCTDTIEDIDISLVNSRKISVRAVVLLRVTALGMYEEDGICEIKLDNIQTKPCKITCMELCSAKKDILRIRESVNLPEDMPNVENIIWHELKPLCNEMRCTDEGINVRGELHIFCIYTCEKGMLHFYDKAIAFSHKLEINGCSDELLADIRITPATKSLIARQDENLELRILDAEVILNVDVLGYMEKEHEVIEDTYSTSYELTPSTKRIEYEAFSMKNTISTRQNRRYSLPDFGAQKVLCCTGKLNIEEVISDDEGISIEGVITAEVLYLIDNENNAIGYAKYELPFEEHAEISPNDDHNNVICKEGVVNVTVQMTGTGEVDVKCAADIELMITRKSECTIITEVKVEAPYYDRLKKIPSLTGYITKTGDTLWDIAKKYSTTIQDILESNNLADTNLTPGMKLLLIKKC